MSSIRILVSDVVEAASELGWVDREALRSKTRMSQVNYWRQRAFVAAYRFTGQSLPQIGRYFGGRNHTTVLWAVRKVEQGDADLAAGAMRVGERAYEIACRRRYAAVSA